MKYEKLGIKSMNASEEAIENFFFSYMQTADEDALEECKEWMYECIDDAVERYIYHYQKENKDD